MEWQTRLLALRRSTVFPALPNHNSAALDKRKSLGSPGLFFVLNYNQAIKKAPHLRGFLYKL